MRHQPTELLQQMFRAAIASAQAEACIEGSLPDKPTGRTFVVGAGKAGAAMARAVERRWDTPLSGLVVTRYGHTVACDSIDIVEASHPVPDTAGLVAAQRMLALVEGLGPSDLVICLFSGGGSALLPLPLDGLTLHDKQAANRELLRCGASISEINCVRRHLSAIKGGRLAAACYPARVVNLLISDVPGDAAVEIASGPTVGDPTSCADALAIVERYAIPLSDTARSLLECGRGESVKPDDSRLHGLQTHLIATPRKALEAAAEVAADAGVSAHILGDRIEGEACELGRAMAGTALQVARYGEPFKAPCVLLSGGETTVTVRGPGRGGRNAEFLLALAIALDGAADIHALAGDTDGIDGSAEVAGAVITPNTLERARARAINPHTALADNDSHDLFEALGDAVVTGPTLTNVNDFRAILVS